LLMEGLSKQSKDEEIASAIEEEVVPTALETAVEAPEVVQEKSKDKGKSFFEKFTARLKDFLDNAE